MKVKRSIYNIIFGFGAQIITLAMGIIIPRLILVGYGSEVNGLLNTVTQIYAYVALLEAGVGTATIQALYGPIIKGDKEEISGIFVAAQNYYRRLTTYYFLCVVLLSVVGPFAIKSDLNPVEIGSVIFLHGMAGVISFYFAATFKQLLAAEGKNYVVVIITFAVQMLTYVAKIVLALAKTNIVFIQLSYFLITLFQVILYMAYYRRKYYWVDLKTKPRKGALKQKNSFLIHEITLTIFNSTDTIVLSTISGLAVASVYAVYNLVFSGLYTIFSTLFNSVRFTLGQIYHENTERYLKLHDAFESIYIGFVFSIISVCYFLILPFIELYTKGVGDANYLDYRLPILFCSIQLLSAIRSVSNNLINVAQHATQTVWRTILEAVINLGVSLIASQYLGIYGVLLGTIVALLYRSNDIIIYANTKILKRKPVRAYKTIALNFALFAVVVAISRYVVIDIQNYIGFIVNGLVLTIILVPSFQIANFVSNKSCLQFLKMICSKFKTKKAI